MGGASKGERAQARPVLVSVLLASTMLTGVTSARADSTIETVVVTAEKRSEDLQRVPLSMQVLGTQKLEELHVASFTDYAQYLPSVAFSSNAAGGGLNDPGSMNVYMRGVASGGDGNHSASLPSVGIYLDEQPVTTIAGAPDIHIYDIARVEALAGPQGTLYGASSEAGTIRIITNKPDASGFSAAYDVQTNTTDRGSVGGSIEGYANIPLADNVAIRLVAWTEHDAGYIDNVAGTDAVAGIVGGLRTYGTLRSPPVVIPPISNAAFRKSNYNNTDILGGRAALKIDLDDNWTITPSLIGQDTKAYGSFAFDPAVGDLKVVKFAPEFSHDRWYQAALTVEGKVANLDVTYAGAYMERQINAQLDYSDYSYFYDAAYGHYITDNSLAVVDPAQKIIGNDHFTKNSHELRVASPTEDRLRFVAGLFYERQTHAIIQDYVIDALGSNLAVPGWPSTLYLADENRVDTDYAAFTEISYRLLPSLTLTAGGRVFESNNSLKGFFGFSENWQTLTGFSSGMLKCTFPSPIPIVHNAPCTNLDKTTDEKGFTHKLNATWQIDDDHMVYFTWSNGFRPGGINRVDLGLVHTPPYAPDWLMNYELGWKTAWLDDTLHFNGALFLEEWKNFQFTFLGPNSIPIIANAGQAQIAGIESDVLWRATDNLTLNGSAAYTDAELTQPYCSDSICTKILAPKGQQLPITPRFKANMTARYDWNLDEFKAHVQGSLVYNGSSWNDLRTIERGITGKDPAYTVANFTGGIGKDDWTLELSLQNAFDERATLYRYSECTPTVCGAQTYIIPNRPRTIGLKFSQKF